MAKKTQVRAVVKFRIKKGDTVEVIQGKENGKRGKVLRVLSADERVVVDGVARAHSVGRTAAAIAFTLHH